MDTATSALLKGPEDPSLDLDLRRRSAEEPGSVLVCAACGRPVTRTSARIAVDGSHEHERENPHGLRFRFGCFALAFGCVSVGQPTTEFTWFPPHAWLVSLCAGCGEHLGWLFVAADSRFYGLIVDRLREIDERLA